ncbi:Nucleolar Complex 2 protein [Agyrium rufum]|nr:Nucleolar Complex 2 protein [Agyrium rufum]
MVHRAKKTTKKFEKNHLKDVLEKRKESAKIKQRYQVKEKKKAKQAKDAGRDGDEDVESQKRSSQPEEKNLGDMTVDEFFAGRVDIPEPKINGKKRKRGQSHEDGSLNDSHEIAAQDPSSDQDEEEVTLHKGDLDALAEKDPEFYLYLKENDAELLEFEETGDIPGLDDLSDQESSVRPRKNKKTKSTEESAGNGADAESNINGDESVEVTSKTLNKWKAAIEEQHSLRATRQVVLAFRAAAYTNDEDDKAYKYIVSSPDVYHELLLVALNLVPKVLEHHLPIKVTNGKSRVPTDSKKFRTLSPLLKSYASSLQHLLEGLSDPSTIKLTLASILPLLPYILSFKKLLKAFTKTTIGIWSDPSTITTESTRISAFLLIRSLAHLADSSLLAAILKSIYQGLITSSRTTNAQTLLILNLLKNSAVDLWAIDPQVGYTTAFTSIRQLAIHLRGSITHPTTESHKQVYNWQYTHSLDFWSRVLSSTCSTSTNLTLKRPQDSPFHPLIYPLVQISLGALRLVPTPTYFPLRFHLVRSLLRVSRQTNTYIPLAPTLLEVFSSPELKRAPKNATLRPLDFRVVIRTPAAYLKTRVYQNGAGDQCVELLGEFFSIWAKNIAFPELIIPPTVLMKRWLKEVSTSAPASQNGKSNKRDKVKKRDRSSGGNNNHKLNSAVQILVQKINANAAFIEEKRRKVTFAPSNRAEVDNFLKDLDWEDTPIGAYVAGQRKSKEERERILDDARRQDEERRGEEERKPKGDGDDDLDGMSAEEDGEEDEMEVEMEGE